MNIFREQKIHAHGNCRKTNARGDNYHNALCGASGNALPKTTSSSHNVTCERCLRIMQAQKGKPHSR